MTKALPRLEHEVKGLLAQLLVRLAAAGQGHAEERQGLQSHPHARGAPLHQRPERHAVHLQQLGVPCVTTEVQTSD